MAVRLYKKTILVYCWGLDYASDFIKLYLMCFFIFAGRAVCLPYLFLKILLHRPWKRTP